GRQPRRLPIVFPAGRIPTHPRILASPMHPTQILRSLALVAPTGPALAAMPASAQRASLADRIAVLEQQAANNRGNVDLLNQVNQIKNVLQAQRSQLEELQRKLEQMEFSGRAQYLDLDGRLNRIESGA